MQYLWQFYLLIGVIGLQGVCLLHRIRPSKVFFVFLCFLEFTFISGFRSWNIGNDTISYVNTFIASVQQVDLWKSHMEYGYLLFNQFLAVFTSNPQILLLVTSIFIIGSWLYSLYKYSNFIFLSVLLFTISAFGTTLTMIRQEMAMCIILLSLPFIIRRQFFSFIICWGIAVSFHTSAFVTMFLYFLYPLQFKFKYLVWIILGTILISIFLAPVLDQIIHITGRYSIYKTDGGLLGEELKLANIMNTLVQLMLTGFCYISYRYVYKSTFQNFSPLRLSFLLWCSVISLCLQCISIHAILLERLVLYFSMFNFISVPLFVRSFPQKIRIFITIGIVLCFTLYQSIVFVYRPEWNHVLPFEFCF